MNDAITPTYEIRTYSPDQLTIDPTIQRRLVPRQLENMTGDKYDPRALGLLVVSDRGNGTRVILDGQHRWNAVKLNDADAELTCITYTGLTKAQEAELFLTFNNQSQVSSIAKFDVAVQAGQALPVAVNKVFETYGLTTGTGQQQIAAVTDCMVIASWPNGLELLDHALDILTGAWSTVATRVASDAPDLDVVVGNRPYRGSFIVGLARIILHYGPQFKPDRMSKALLNMGTRGPQDLAQKVASAKSILGRVSVGEAAAHCLVMEYNKLPGGGKLDRWPIREVASPGSARYALSDLLNNEVPEASEVQ